VGNPTHNTREDLEDLRKVAVQYLGNTSKKWMFIQRLRVVTGQKDLHAVVARYIVEGVSRDLGEDLLWPR